MAFTVTPQHKEKAEAMAKVTGLNPSTIIQLIQEFGPVVLAIVERLFPNLFPNPTPVPPVPPTPAS